MAQAPAMRPTGETVDHVLDGVSGARRDEAVELVALHRDASGCEPVVWAGRILGFGERTATHDAPRMPLLAFAPGRAHTTLYLPEGFADRWSDLLDRLGRHRTAVSCLYLPRLASVDASVLRAILERAVEDARAS